MADPSDSTTAHPDPPLAYRNDEFLDRPEARPLRILAEYLQPFAALHKQRVQETVVFFGSARIEEEGPLGRYYQEARELARLVTAWSKKLDPPAHRFLVCTGGGGGIMEAANRGASDAGGRNVGFGISLPREQRPNRFITRELSFQFHYFFMRKLWLAHLARAMVAFPGGFGTLDELFEMLTLAQTQKLDRPMLILLYGKDYWGEIINFEALVRHAVISPEDVDLFRIVDHPVDAFEILKRELATEKKRPTPALAHSRKSEDPPPKKRRRRS